MAQAVRRVFNKLNILVFVLVLIIIALGAYIVVDTVVGREGTPVATDSAEARFERAEAKMKEAMAEADEAVAELKAAFSKLRTERMAPTREMVREILKEERGSSSTP